MGQATEERMTSTIADTRDHLSSDVDALYDKVSPGRVAQRRKQAVRGRMSSLKQSVMGSAADAGDATQDAMATVQDTASSAAETVEKRVEGAPLAAGLVAFGAGMVVSALIPASGVEAQAARRLTDAVKDSQVLDEAKAEGQDVAAHLKESATGAVDEVRSSAQESVAHVRDEGAAAAQTVKEQAPGT